MMAISSRGYHDFEDLLRIGGLIRRAFPEAPGWNGWSFARYDIWAQRRIADAQVHGELGWQRKIRLWESESGHLAAAAFFGYPFELVMISDPAVRGLEGELLDWGEQFYQEHAQGEPPLTVEAKDSHTYLSMLLRNRGYKQKTGHMIFRGKRCQLSEEPPLPAGYSIQVIESDADLEKFFAGVAQVFNFHDSAPVYRLVQRAPSYLPKLDLMLLDENGELASFCSLWSDAALGLAEFEPVGTLPAFRGRGLASALLRSAESRLAATGCRRLSVFSGSESAAANALYQSVGLIPVDTVNQWQLQQPPPR